MIGVVIFQNGASAEQLNKTLAAAKSSGLNDIVTIVDGDAKSADSNTISRGKSDAYFALLQALSLIKASRILLIDASLAPSLQGFQAALGGLSRIQAPGLAYAPLAINNRAMSLPDLSAATFITFLASSPEWPSLMVMVDRESIERASPIAGESFSEMLAHLMAKIAAAKKAIQSSAFPIVCSRAPHNSLRMSEQALARVLLTLINAANIEDLFPQLGWEQDEQESAALAYQSIAAVFIKFGDIKSAEESIRLSEKLEDSPRSLALKALIAKTRGEMLGAVANMVASLQQYEAGTQAESEGAKEPRQTLIIERSDLDSISDYLEAGLSALNRSDNEAALKFFSDAVFKVDPFFKNSGLC